MFECILFPLILLYTNDSSSSNFAVNCLKLQAAMSCSFEIISTLCGSLKIDKVREDRDHFVFFADKDGI
jgi:hypothetical protein